MHKLNDHIAFKQAANLLIVGSIVGVLFGEGVHLHSVFDHLFHHGDIHMVVHAHASDEIKTDSAFHGEDAHQHEVASVDLNGVRYHPGKNKIKLIPVSVVSPSSVDLIASLNNQPPTLFDLPPPEQTCSQYHSFSFSLRGPPSA